MGANENDDSSDKQKQKTFLPGQRDVSLFLITPVILIVLYATFLANVYKDSFLSALPDTVQISEKLINGTVAAQLAAALLSVSCITVTFCVNLTMVQDLANGARKDFNVSPVKKSVIFWDTFFQRYSIP